MNIEIRDLSFRYGEKVVFDHLNLTIPEGRITALTGESGRGKTTLISLLAGLLPMQEGTITGLPEEGVSMVFQEDRLLEHLTVEENLKLIAPRYTHRELTELLDRAGLTGENGSLPGSLSGGMKRRVAILRALIFPRKLLLLDEPFKGLDQETRLAMMELVRELGKGRTILLVTHDPEEIRLMGAGSLSLDGTGPMEYS